MAAMMKEVGSDEEEEDEEEEESEESKKSETEEETETETEQDTESETESESEPEVNKIIQCTYPSSVKTVFENNFQCPIRTYLFKNH